MAAVTSGRRSTQAMGSVQDVLGAGVLVGAQDAIAGQVNPEGLFHTVQGVRLQVT